MPDPVHAWAAVAPDGAIEPNTLATRAGTARSEVSNWLFREPNESHRQGWRRAYRAGWRVVPVEIKVMEGQKDG